MQVNQSKLGELLNNSALSFVCVLEGVGLVGLTKCKVKDDVERDDSLTSLPLHVAKENVVGLLQRTEKNVIEAFSSQVLAAGVNSHKPRIYK